MPNESFTRLQYLNEQGVPEKELPPFAQVASNLIPLYKAMVRTRIFDEKAVELQRTGRLGTYASSLGQEAVSVGIAAAMQAEDVFLPSFREQGGMLLRGVTMEELLLFWGGDERGSDFQGPDEDFPICIPVSTQFPHACGVALAFKLRNEKRVAMVVGGDGSTSKGDFYEAINIAGVWKLPVVFVITNNQWAISVPRSDQSAAETLGQKAVAAGIVWEQVDGNDIIAVRDSVERARSLALSEGPSLIEAITYRIADHTTADDARRYRDEEEVKKHWKSEPIGRLRTFLAEQKVWDKEQEKGLLKAAQGEVDHAAENYLNTTEESPTVIFDHLFQSLPHELGSQYAELLHFVEEENG